MSHHFTRVRLGEWLGALWLSFIGLVGVLSGRSHDLLVLKDESVRYSPAFLLLLVALGRYLLPLTFVSAVKLGQASLALAGRTSARPREGLNFEQELALARKMASFLRDSAPLFLFLFVYPTTDFLNDSLQGHRLADRALARLDVLLFGGHPSVWAGRFASAPLTDVLSLCYLLHLVLPMAVLLFLYLGASRATFVEAVQGFTAMATVGFAGYLLVPAVGPRYAFPDLYAADLSGGLARELNEAVIDTTRVPRDAFPSMHVGLSALLLLYAWRARRWFGLLVLPLTVGNWLATIYLRYHYGVDVLAGFVLVPLIDRAVRGWSARFGHPVEG